MNDPTYALLGELEALGLQHHSRFDAGQFRAIGGGAAARLWERTRDAPGAELALCSYLRLLSEAVGMGCTTRDPAGAHRSLLSLLFTDLVPALLPEVAPERRAHALAEAWNLGEGLLAEPAWMNRYAAAMCADLPRLADLAQHLAAVLSPVLAPRPPSQWQGAGTVKVLDARSVRDDFLPGAMHLAAPSVACVHDRRTPRSQLGVFLDYEGRSALLGPAPCPGMNLHEGNPVAAAFASDSVEVRGRRFAVPFLRAPSETLVTAAGFVLACAPDSQRIWVVDIP